MPHLLWLKQPITKMAYISITNEKAISTQSRMGYQHDIFVLYVAAGDYSFHNKPFSNGYRWLGWDSSYRLLWIGSTPGADY